MYSPSAGDELVVKPGGLVIAGVGFLSTRFLLADFVYVTHGSTLVHALPLALGLGIVLYGVDLSVSTHSRSYARTVAVWFLLGGVFMGIAGGIATLSQMGGPMGVELGSVLATMIVAGGGAGVVVGVRSAAMNKQRRAIDRQREQTVLLNRRLRHELLNALTVIRGHTDMLADDTAPDPERSRAAVTAAVGRIEDTVGSIGFLSRTARDTRTSLAPFELDSTVEATSAALPPEVADRFETPPSVRVRADDHLQTLLTEVASLPDVNGGRSDASVTFGVAGTSVDVTVTAPGRWLSDRDHEVLTNGVGEYERNDVDYGIPIVRLLTAQYEGTVESDRSDGSTSVRIQLPRTGEHAPPRDAPGVDTQTLWASFGIGIVAGVVMGVVLTSTAGSLAVIGSLYGAETSLAGWIAHLFHSAVFATVFAVIATKSQIAERIERFGGSTLVGVAWGAVLWVVASGVILGLWLNAVGIDAPVPNLDAASLVGHVVWGAVVGGLWAVVPTITVPETTVSTVRGWLSE